MGCESGMIYEQMAVISISCLSHDAHTVDIAFVPPDVPNLKPAWFRNVFPKGKNLTCFWQC